MQTWIVFLLLIVFVWLFLRSRGTAARGALAFGKSRAREVANETVTFSDVAGVDEAGVGPLAGPVAAAAVILPITERDELAYTLGTRHRAAIGISEQSDAIVLVVSEENRAISLVHEGDIKRGLSLEDLKAELERVSLVRGRRGRRKNKKNAGESPAAPGQTA